MATTKKPVKYAVVDAFTDAEFKGNPAAVCLLEEERDEEWMQSVAAEFNISETCYLTRVPASESDSPHPRFGLRWFTPVIEVDLCGHATMAASYFCFTSGLVKGSTVEFATRSGILTAHKVIDPKELGSPSSDDGNSGKPFFIELDFPAISIIDCNAIETSPVSKLLSDPSMIDVKKTGSEDLFVVLPSATDVANYQPDMEEIMKWAGRGLIISAPAPPSSEFDIFSRFFCPQAGINEDPVCGSAHCALVVYWSKKLGKHDLLTYAASPRGGVVKLHLDEQLGRVKLQGKAVTVMEGFVMV